MPFFWFKESFTKNCVLSTTRHKEVVERGKVGGGSNGGGGLGGRVVGEKKR